jgi:DNA-directed RNA polymerase subunit RPC12/RpoP
MELMTIWNASGIVVTIIFQRKEHPRKEVQTMSNEKQQIEDMAHHLCLWWDGKICTFTKHECNHDCSAFLDSARLYEAGYRKQSEGEWIGKTDYAGYGYYCSNCNAVFTGENAEWIAKEHYYCPKCGAKMKGGAE